MRGVENIIDRQIKECELVLKSSDNLRLAKKIKTANINRFRAFCLYRRVYSSKYFYFCLDVFYPIYDRHFKSRSLYIS